MAFYTLLMVEGNCVFSSLTSL